MPIDKYGRTILSDKSYIEYLEKIVTRLLDNCQSSDRLYIDKEYFIVYNIEECISHQQEYRKENDGRC